MSLPPGSRSNLAPRSVGHGPCCATPSAVVFYQEWNELGAKQQHLKEWGSLLRVHTRSEKQKAAMKRAQLDAMEEVLKEE
jgi:hypothetical protein